MLQVPVEPAPMSMALGILGLLLALAVLSIRANRRPGDRDRRLELFASPPEA